MEKGLTSEPTSTQNGKDRLFNSGLDRSPGRCGYIPLSRAVGILSGLSRTLKKYIRLKGVVDKVFSEKTGYRRIIEQRNWPLFHMGSA